MPDKIWTREEINNLLNTRPAAVERGIVRLYIRQAASERASEATVLHNGIGFNSAWARPGTYLARWVLSGRRLSGKHLDRARRCCLLHSQQLTDYANGAVTQLERDWEARHRGDNAEG